MPMRTAETGLAAATTTRNSAKSIALLCITTILHGLMFLVSIQHDKL